MDPQPRSVNQLVEQQVLRWQAAQRQKESERLAAAKPPPIVTISRQTWSRGTQLGKLVADRLEYDFWDQELVHRIAEEAGAPEMLLQAVDEHARNAIEDIVAGALRGDAFTVKEYRAQLLRVVHAISKQGRSVVIGRGAQFAIESDPALRVRVVCPVEQRARNLAQAHAMTEKDARKEIDRIDHDRQAFVRQQYGKDVTDPVHYDLVINTGTLTLEQAADVLEAAYRAKFG